ncbi:MAG TPA: FAD-binding protein [Solirubrobacteraceae bacterium]|nr:FAD-binding protein [Solirubrobacteraceae bacterium]
MNAETESGLVNWSGSHRYQARALHAPETVEELQRLIAGARGTLQVLATRHTFSGIGDADELISLDRLPGARAIEIDAAARTATVGPAVTYAELAAALNARGLALENMASLPHISVAGAVATATHGSGTGLGNLATAVRGLELIGGDGERVTLTEDDPRLPGAAVHLGALGVVTAVALAVRPYYELRQDVYLGLEWEALAQHFDAVMGAGRSVSVFHDFGERAREVWVKGDPEDGEPGAACGTPGELYGAVAAREARNPVPGAPAENATPQLGSVGPWSERLPHFRSGFTPSAGQEIQSEWFVAREDGVAAIQALRPLGERIRAVLQVAELRVIAADELWMSPQHGRETAALHFTWRLEPGPVAEVCAEIERALASLQVRPHWGKLFPPGPAPWAPDRLADFLALRDELDPTGRFVNGWLRERLLDGGRRAGGGVPGAPRAGQPGGGAPRAPRAGSPGGGVPGQPRGGAPSAPRAG